MQREYPGDIVHQTARVRHDKSQHLKEILQLIGQFFPFTFSWPSTHRSGGDLYPLADQDLNSDKGKAVFG